MSLLSIPTAAHAVAIALDFERADFQDSFTRNNPPPGEIRWNNILCLFGVTGPAGRIDMVATVASGSAYSFSTVPPRNTNGSITPPAVPGGAILLKVEAGTDVSFNFNSFTETGNPIALTTDISFLDFDQTDSIGQGIADEKLNFLGINSLDQSSYTYTTTTEIGIDYSNTTQPSFSSRQGES
ncbi:MAG: hypothetical protein AAGH40_00015 [Verrucomicrobiota bacterium]